MVKVKVRIYGDDDECYCVKRTQFHVEEYSDIDAEIDKLVEKLGSEAGVRRRHMVAKVEVRTQTIAEA